MTNEIPKKSEGPIELENTELETVAGGTGDRPPNLTFKAYCNTCHWESASGTPTEARNAETEHRQNYPGHLVMVVPIGN